MATRTTKKATPRKPAQKAKKNASGAAVSVPIRRFNERLYAESKKQLAATNIPALKTISQDKDLIEHYFQNRPLYTHLLGEHIQIFDRVMRSAFATILTKDMMTGLIEKENTTFPGLWDEFHIKLLFITMLNVVTLSDKPDAGTFFSVRRPTDGNTMTSEEVKEFSETSWMPFREYEPVRFYRFMMVVYQTVLSTMLSEIETKVPAATFSASGEPVTIRYGRQFGELMRVPLEDKDEVTMTIDEQADSYIKKLERPLFTYMTTLLSESGFGLESVTEAFSKSRAAVTYSVTNKGSKTASTFIHPWTRIQYNLISEDNALSARCELCPDDVRIAASVADANTEVDEETGETKQVPVVLTTEQRNACNRLGKSIGAFMESLSTYIINLAIIENNVRVKDEIAALTAAAEQTADSAE